MSVTDDLDFDSWFDIFLDHLRLKLKYNGPIHKYGVEGYYEHDLMYPEEAAEAFFKEMS